VARRGDGRERRRRRARRDALDRPPARLRLGRLSTLGQNGRLEKYAELAVRVGANVQEGQDVAVTCLVEHADIARAIAREAYRAGARHVLILYGDQHLRRATIELGPEEELGWSAPHLVDLYNRWYEEQPALIALTGNPDPDLLSTLDSSLVGRSEPKELRALSVKLLSDRRVNWTVVSAPNEGWATQVFGEPDLDRLWDAVAVSTRLDEPDVVGAWREQAAKLEARAAQMNERAFDAIRFRGPSTDLTIGLNADGMWKSATNKTAGGIEHLPNLPTEEVFTSPDWRRTEGTVRSTAPLIAAGTRVDDLELRFENGKIVEVEASAGKGIIEEQLSVDEQAGYLGEVALVDGSSAVKKTGLVFHDTLFDENATCHIAYGVGFPLTLEGGTELERDELLQRGINVSNVHTDFMIGGPEVEVVGVAADGSETPVITGEAWQLT
jgi:aminopeptidase